MISSCKLPFDLDPQLLRVDLERLGPEVWTPHFNKGYYEGDWAGLALRSNGGATNQLYSHPKPDGFFVDTPALDRCPNIRAAVELFECPMRAVRLLRLTAGSSIREHRDFDLSYEDGQLRFHIPIVTNTKVIFFLDAHQVEMKEGECWYLDLSLPHWVENQSASDRVHLVIDCEANDWLRELLSTAEAEDARTRTVRSEHEECPPCAAELERFRQAVFGDLSLQQQLRCTKDWESFGRLVVSLGRDRGYRFTLADVEAGIQAGRRSWIERWVD